jgi:hypothetical protein
LCPYLSTDAADNDSDEDAKCRYCNGKFSQDKKKETHASRVSRGVMKTAHLIAVTVLYQKVKVKVVLELN